METRRHSEDELLKEAMQVAGRPAHEAPSFEQLWRGAQQRHGERAASGGKRAGVAMRLALALILLLSAAWLLRPVQGSPQLSLPSPAPSLRSPSASAAPLEDEAIEGWQSPTDFLLEESEVVVRWSTTEGDDSLDWMMWEEAPAPEAEARQDL